VIIAEDQCALLLVRILCFTFGGLVADLPAAQAVTLETDIGCRSHVVPY